MLRSLLAMIGLDRTAAAYQRGFAAGASAAPVIHWEYRLTNALRDALRAGYAAGVASRG